MDHCIYHSRDLDGLTSGAIIYNTQKAFGEDCTLTGYDYGQKLDTRIFKGKSAIMIDVSMEMERMELLGKNCMEFIWVDHHKSAYDTLHTYCEEKGYKMSKNRYNDLIERIEVNGMNMIYFYSSKLSACEVTSILYGKHLGSSSRKLVSILGQYDTWRQSDEKKFATDEDWLDTVLPVQYFMRTCKDPKSVDKIFSEMNSWTKPILLDEIISHGKYVLQYQKIINDGVAKNNFDFELAGLRVIALNTTTFNSMSFEGYYHEEIHDAMMPFMYNGKTKKWMFSLYTTKDDIDILSVAKRFGGGGHAQACGFSINPEFVKFGENTIEFGDLSKSEFQFVKTPEQIPSLFTSEKPSKKGYVHKEFESTDYLIPNFMSKQFDNSVLNDREEFDNKFSKFIVTPKID